MLKTSTTKTFMGAASLLLLSSVSAFAFDNSAFATRFAEVFGSETGTVIAYGSVTGDASNLVLQDVILTPMDGEAVDLGAMTLENITEVEGVYNVGKTLVPDISIADDEISFSMTGLTIEGLQIPTLEDQGKIIIYDRAELPAMAVKLDSQDFINAINMVVDVDANDDLSVVSFTTNIENMMVDIRPAKPDAKTLGIAEALDLVTIAGSVTMNGDWSATTGATNLSEFSMDVPENGKLAMKFGLTGYNLELIRAMQEAGKAMQDAGADENAKAMQGMALLGLAQQLSYTGAEISFVEDGLASKVLDFLAAQQGMDRATMIAQTKAIIPFITAQLQKPEFSAQVTKAVGTFMDDPKSLTITANPPAPVPAALLAASGMTAPQNLIDQLNVQVTAND